MLIVLMHLLKHWLTHHCIADIVVEYIDRVTGMMTDEHVAVSQDRDSSDGTATKHFLVTWILFDHQITAVQWMLELVLHRI